MKLKQFIFAFMAMLLCFSVSVNAQVAKVGNTEFATIDEAIAAWGNNSTLTLLADVTLSDVVKLKSTEHHTLDLGTYTMTAASGKNAIEITCEGRSSASYAITVNADATNPGGITATGKACVYYSKSGSTKDRPIIRIYNGVFNGSYSINSKSNGNTNCPQVWIYGGTFNGNVNLAKNMLRVFGGTFNGWINCTGDSSAYREISGGRFKSWQFMTADADSKFWVGTSKANYNVGLYVDDEGYLVVGGDVITEAGDKFEASSTNYGGWSSYLKYSSAATNDLYYTSIEEAFADNNKATGSVTVYVDELDMAGISYKGTIVVPEGNDITITNAPSTLKVQLADGTELTPDKNGTVATKLEVATLAELQAALASTTNVPIVITAQIEIPEGETVELDLKGKTVNSVFNGTSTTNHIYALSNKGTLTIKDSKGNGSINSRGIYNYSSLILNAGAINAIDGNGGYAVNNQSGSTFVMNGGVVAATNEDDHKSSSGGYDATALKVPAGCTATLNGGTINNVCDFTFAIDAAGTLNIPETSTITVNGTHGAIAVSGGVTTINAGTYTIPKDDYSRTDNVLYVSGGSLVVNGGTFIGDSDTAGGGACLWDAAGKAVVNGGTFKGSSGGDVWGTTGTTIKGGTFENLTEKQHIADGYELGADGTVVAKSVASINGTKYTSLAEAVAAAQNGETITLIDNVVLAERVTIPADKTLTIDLNGKSISMEESIIATAYAINNLGNLTITDGVGGGSINARGIYNGYGDGATNVATAKIIVLSGTINAKGTNGGAAIFNYGVADIQGGNFTSIGGYSLNNQSGASMTIADGVTANNGIYASGTTLVVNGGEINGNRSGCHVLYAWNSAVTINGGTFYNYNSGNSTIMAAGTTELTINGGTFSIKDGRVPGNGNTWTSCLTDTQNSATMTVNGGTFNGGFRVQAGTTMTIAGGEFNDCYGSGYNIYGTAIVKGGTFTDDAAKKFAKNNIAAGYELGENGTVKEVTPAAVIGTQKYATLQAAIEAVKEGETITLLDNVNVTTPAYGQNALNHARAINFTLDLNGKTLSADTGNSVFRFNIANSGATSNVTLTIKNGKIVAGSNTWCAVMASGISSDIKAIMNLEDLTIEASKAGDLAVKAWDNATINAKEVTVNTTNAAGGFYAVGGEIILDDCTVNQKGLHTAPYLSMAFAVSSNGKMTVNSGTYSAEPTAAAEGNNQGSTHGSWVGGVMNSGGELIINGGTFSNGNFGDDALATYARGLIFADTNGKVTVSGGTFNALKSIFDFQNNLGGTSPVITVKGGNYSANPEKVTSYGSIVLEEGYSVVDNNNGVWTVERGLAGAGTEAEPYLINNVSDLKFFRDEVNKGVANKYNVPGVWVALGADIDLSGENWVGIGSATADHGFMGNFDGKTFKIKNLTITNPALDSDGYAYAGLFGVTEGTDKNNQNTIKNLTIENVTITTTGHIAAAAVAYPYYTIIDNVKVCGDIKIQGGDYTAGVLAYTRRCVNASNLSIVGKEGSYVKGNITVGGVISDIQMNGGLTADYKNFSAEGLTISGEKSVGGISGIICKQTLDGATVKNVTLVCNNASVGIVSGSWGDVSTISNVIYENVTGATAIVGATWKEGNAVEAKIGNTYYATLDAAYKAAQEGATVELLAPVVIASGETLTLDKNVTVVYTSNVAGEDMFTNRGTLNISAGTITYANTDATASNVTVSTISSEPGSVLNITGGTVENKTVKADGSSIYSFAIDMLTNGNLGDVTATIAGGTVSSDYMAIRQFNNGTACKNSLTISNGYIYGAKRAVQIHMDNNAAVTAISGGKIEAGKDGYALCNFAKTSALSVTDGEFIGAVYSASEKFISGGIYNNPVEAAYCKEGYMPNVIADGKYGVTAVANLVATTNGFGYKTLAEAIAASTPETGWGGEVTLLKNVTLEGGYTDTDEGLRIEKSVTINGAGYTIDCGTFKKGIRIYQNGDQASNVMFKHVNIVNNNNQGRCIDTRSAKINLMLNGFVNLTAHGTNSQPLTIGGSEAMTKVTISGGTIDAGTSGYGVICFVPVTNHINVQGNAVIKGLAAFYLKEGVTNTAIKLSQSTSIGTNKYASASGVFGAVVIEGSNNAVRLEHSGAVVKAVAADGAEMAAQAAFLVRGEGNTINILAENAQVITEGKNAYRAIVNTDVAASAKMIEKGNELKLVAENRGYQFYSFEEAVRFAGNEGTIKVVNDFELAEVWTVAEGQNITLDLNGKTLSTAYVAGSTTNHLYAIHNYGELTITDSSDAKTGKISARGIFNYGNMTLTSGTINAIDGNGGYGVRNYAGATFTMNGGTIATTYEDGDVPGEGYDASPVRVDEGATFTMNDGVINNVSNYTVAIDNYGTTIINGGKATTIHTTLANSGTMIIEGGEFTCNGLEGITAHALWAADGTTTINGGTFNGKDNYNGFNVDASEGAVVTITGGTFLPVHSGSLYGDGTITVSGGTFFDKISDQRCELGFQAVANEYGTYTVKETGCRNAMTIVDGEVTEFVNEKEITVGTLTYTRGKIKNTWTPFYVPFAVPVSALADKFDVAYINDVRRTDSDNDGELDKFSMEVILIHCESKNVNGSSKTLKANYPYFIRSKSGQEVTMEIALTDAKLYAAKENVFDCTTMTEKFEIKGNYHQIFAEELDSKNDYVVGGGEWHHLETGKDYSLNPFRFYMTRSSRDGSDPTTMAPMKSMKIVVCGEEDENGATIIYDVVEDSLNNNGNDYIYDLQGRRVSEPKKGGIYIKNGKKILF